MFKSTNILLLAVAIYGFYARYGYAAPVISTTDLDIDDEDSEVIEIDLNSIDIPENNPKEDIIDLSSFGEAIYGTPDSDVTAKLVANYSAEESEVNPEELGSYLEGDILVPAGAVLTKNGIAGQSSRWPNGVVPFEVRGHFTGRDLATIENAMEEYHRRTCIRFVPRTRETDYISIVSGNSGCWSSVGRVGGKQEVNLQSPGCLTKVGTPLHELMHALGFLHEQNRAERDTFVSIQFQNIQPHAVTNFDKSATTVAFGVPYDYSSVMHYSANAFSSNGRPTIVAVQPGGSQQMGQRDGFSAFDVEKLNKMYNCGYGVGPSPAVPAPGQYPAPAPAPAPAPVVPNVVGSFLGGLISGLGLGDEDAGATPPAEPAV